MLLRYWQDALLTASAILMGHVAWAQQSCPYSSGGRGCAQMYSTQEKCIPPTQVKCGKGRICGEAHGCGQTGDCCKDGKCCKENKCCKEGKCECTSGGKCCCNKGECHCKDKTRAKGHCHGCCPFLSMMAKRPAIVVVVSPTMPMFAPCHPGAAMMPTPPGPFLPPTSVLMPPGLGCPPPHLCCPGYDAPNCIFSHPTCVAKEPCCDGCRNIINTIGELCTATRPSCLCMAAMNVLSNAMTPAPTHCPVPEQLYCIPTNCGGPCYGYAPVPPCATTRAAAPPAAGLRVVAKTSSDQLEMNVGDQTRVHGKKMAVQIGAYEISLRRFDDRVRVRGDDLKATADCVCSIGNDCLVLEGDVVLHYKKDGHCANVTGDCIEVNLSSGAVTIQPAAKKPTPSVRIDRVDTDK